MGENYVTIRDSKVYVKTIGQGEKLVFLHGGPGGEHRFFLPHIQALSEEYELVFYDQKGCGKSEPLSDPSQYSMDEEVQTLEELRKALGIKKLNLIGESWGSMLALLYATTYPSNVKKVLLTAAVGATSEGFTVFANELQTRMTQEDKELLEDLSNKFQNQEVELKEIFKVLDPYYVYSKDVLHRKTKTESNHVVNGVIGENIRKNYDVREKLSLISHVRFWCSKVIMI
jgi:proline iminopeptidase